MIRDVIWDFDGTLFDTYPATVSSFKRALKDNGINETDENILNYLKISERCAVCDFKELYGLNDDFIDKFKLYKKAIELESVRPFPFALEVCKKLVQLGGKNYIVTHRGDSTLRLLQYYGIQDYFTEIITKKYGFKRKPDPEAFLYLIEKYSIDKNSALVVGDRECEIIGAKSAGIKVCLYNTNNVKFAEMPDINIHSLQEVIDLIG